MATRPIVGDAWTPSASEHRRFQRVADAYDRSLLAIGLKPLRLQLGPGTCRVKNASGAARDRFDVLGIDDCWLDPAVGLEAWQSQMPLEGTTPAVADHDGRFVALIMPGAEDQIVWAVASGLAVAQVEVTSGLDWYEYADVTDGDATKLTLFPAGAAQVLWKESGTGTKWAIVRLGVPGIMGPFYAKCDEELVAGGSGTVSIYRRGPGGDWDTDTGRDVEAYVPPLLPSGATSIAQDAWVEIGWHRDERDWLVEQAECEAVDYYGY
jgi:hypothetical protein